MKGHDRRCVTLSILCKSIKEHFSENRDTIITLLLLIRIYIQQGRPEEAEPLAIEGLKICKETLGEKDDYTIIAATSRGQRYRWSEVASKGSAGHGFRLWLGLNSTTSCSSYLRPPRGHSSGGIDFSIIKLRARDDIP